MYTYIGDCITGLQDANFRDFVKDVTEMAQAETREEEISYSDFCSVVSGDVHPKKLMKSGNGFSFRYEDEIGLIWAYDKKNDIHYFYASLGKKA